MTKLDGLMLKSPRTFILGFLIAILFGLSVNSSAQMNTWKEKADIPQFARTFLSTATLNGKIYVMGGYYDIGVTAQVEEYDPITNNWVSKASMPEARDCAPTLVLDNKIYVFGGLVEPDLYALSRIDVYDPITDTWKTIGDMPSPGCGMAVSIVNGKIYVMGGYYDIGVTAQVEEYDPVTDIWTKKSDMPTPRVLYYDTSSSPVVNGKIYIIGGTTKSYPQVPSSAVEEYDPVTDTWARKADMPVPKWGFGISEVNGKIFVIGGMGDRSIGTIYQTVEMYNPSTDTWTKKADMPRLWGGFSAVPIGAYIYVIGTGSSVYEYDTGLGMEVRAISPQEASTTGGTPIAISGSGFNSDLIVTIGDKPLSDQKVTYNLVTGIIPPNTEGEKDIVFTVPSFNYSTVVDKFFYKPASNVVVTKITPNNGKQAGGDIASISGSGFIPGAIVMVGGNLGTNVGVTPTLITFRIPPETEGTKDVVVTNPDGQKYILRNGYTYNPFPVIYIISPRYGGPLVGGTEITIKGTNFIQGVTVYIGSERISNLDFFSLTELRFRTPPGTEGMKPIRVVNPDGQEATIAEGFRYNNAPNIYSIEPSAGALEGGTRVTITGRNFDVMNVSVGKTLANIQSGNSDSITIITPPTSAGAKDIVVENWDGQTDTLEKAFAYNPAPVITGITPNNGKLSGGIKITIQGSGFMPEAKVFIGILGQDIVTTVSIWSWEYVSPTMMTALLPSSKEPKIVSIVVVNLDDQKAILKDGFTYNSIPAITSVQPDNGPSSGGTTLVIKGSGFLLGAKVQVGYNIVSAIVKDDSTIEAITPSGQPGIFSVGVINPDTQSVFISNSFIYIGKKAYNYPNPFRASQGTTFRYVSKDKVSSMEVRIFNTGGVPIDIVQ
ncbi:MAG: IPT/TIG domain-containing protein, partial [Chloroflexi bacterium]|nr:IPT/TIG domain-containing protein [Chloroflexota bacterium]